MDKYLDDYGELNKSLVAKDLKQALEYIQDIEYEAAAELLEDIAEALHNCEE